MRRTSKKVIIMKLFRHKVTFKLLTSNNNIIRGTFNLFVSLNECSMKNIQIMSTPMLICRSDSPKYVFCLSICLNSSVKEYPCVFYLIILISHILIHINFKCGSNKDKCFYRTFNILFLFFPYI